MGDALATLTFVDGGSADTHVQRALVQYLDGTGRRALVNGFARRARERLRGALDELADR